MRPRAAEVIGDKPPKESIRAVVIFGSAEDAETFCVKACGARLKGRLPFFGIKTAGQLRYPSGRVPRRPGGAGGAEGVAQAGDEDDGEVEEGDAVEREGVSRGEQGPAHAQKEGVKFGALFDSLLGGGGLLGDVEGGDVGKSGDAGGAAAAVLSFGLALTCLGGHGCYTKEEARSSLHILDKEGRTMKSSESLSSERQLSPLSFVAVALPVGASVVEHAAVKADLESALPALRDCQLVLMDVMTAAAVEFSDGWYSNMYDAAPQQLLMVQMHAQCLQLGMAAVSPSLADVVHTVESDRCGDDQLAEEVAGVAALRIQEAVASRFAWAPKEGGAWWPHGPATALHAMVPKIIADIGSKGEALVEYTYVPVDGGDCPLLVDVVVSVTGAAAHASARTHTFMPTFENMGKHVCRLKWRIWSSMRKAMEEGA